MFYFVIMHIKRMIQFDMTVPGSSLISAGILSDQSFSSLKDSVSELTLKAVEEMGFNKMTEIQVS